METRFSIALSILLITSSLVWIPAAGGQLGGQGVLAASGGQPASLNGTAVRLAVYPTPSALLPAANSTGEVFVQLQDPGGNPATASTPVAVTLASSRTDVARVTTSLVIGAGSTYGTAYAYASFGTGNTTITASATGMATGFAQLTVVGPSASKLSVTVAPGVLAAGTSEKARVVVQLQSSTGIPTPAPTPVAVRVTSSNTTVGTITNSSFTIPAGASFGYTNLMALGRGSTSVTALAQGYVSGNFTATVVFPVTGSSGQLSLASGTPVILPDRGSYGTLVVQLQNKSGVPMVAAGDVTVYLSSSNTAVGSVDASAFIPSGTSFAVVALGSTLAAGSTTITASAFNFASAAARITSVGPVPFKLAVVSGPALLVANGSPYATTAVELQDASGNPAKAPVDILVNLASSNPGAGDVSPATVIQSGKSYSFVQFLATGNAGSTQITASAPGYVSGQGLVTSTNLPFSGSIALLTQGPQALSTVKVELNVTSGLHPLPGATVTWSVDRKLMTVVNASELTDSGGGAVAYVYLAGSGNLTVSATAAKLGYGTGSFSVRFPVRSQTMNILLIPVNTFVNESQSTSITAQVTAKGKPLAGVVLSWSSNLGSVAPAATTTDSSGSSTVNFVSPTNGTASVTAAATLGGYATTNSTTQITVAIAGSSAGGGGGGGGGPSLGGSLFGVPLMYLLVIPVVLVLALVLVRRRRKGKKKKAQVAEGEAGSDEEEGGA